MVKMRCTQKQLVCLMHFLLNPLKLLGGRHTTWPFIWIEGQELWRQKKRWGLYHQNGAMLWGYVYAMFTGFVVGWNVAQLETLDLDGFSHLVQWFSHCMLQLRRSNRLLPSNALSLDQNMCLWMQGKHDVFFWRLIQLNTWLWLATTYHIPSQLLNDDSRSSVAPTIHPSVFPEYSQNAN